ncbi:MAG: helix-turn-helix transcriptional regulator [Acutalibacteraceae bacterium]|nr:helix-turn-helix transcriptional regulator [Acutalibacteraceae bacterium]
MPDTIALQIMEERKKLGLSQAELAERTGLKQSNISRAESGKYNPTIEFLGRLAEGLGKKLYIELR